MIATMALSLALLFAGFGITLLAAREREIPPTLAAIAGGALGALANLMGTVLAGNGARPGADGRATDSR